MNRKEYEEALLLVEDPKAWQLIHLQNLATSMSLPRAVLIRMLISRREYIPHVAFNQHNIAKTLMEDLGYEFQDYDFILEEGVSHSSADLDHDRGSRIDSVEASARGVYKNAYPTGVLVFCRYSYTGRRLDPKKAFEISKLQRGNRDSGHCSWEDAHQLTKSARWVRFVDDVRAHASQYPLEPDPSFMVRESRFSKTRPGFN